MLTRPLPGATLPWKRIGTISARIATLALALWIALPARAGDDRAIKSRVAPVYPEIAKRMKITGEVRIETVVDADGKVKQAKAISGNHVLGEAAEDAVRKWRFQPGAGESTVVVAVNFTLTD
jgi:TonB family protein